MTPTIKRASREICERFLLTHTPPPFLPQAETSGSQIKNSLHLFQDRGLSSPSDRVPYFHEMGSAGAAGLAAPPPSAVCCMCGDPGLPVELFRCRVCLYRSQHKYCSDLYPKAETYKACNWCLREERGKAIGRELATTSDSNSGQSGNGSGSLGWKLQRGASPLQLSKPVKKQRAPERAAATPTEKLRTEQELSPGTGRVRQTFRGKVRRYKLLEEVSS